MTTPEALIRRDPLTLQFTGMAHGDCGPSTYVVRDSRPGDKNVIDLTGLSLVERGACRELALKWLRLLDGAETP